MFCVLIFLVQAVVRHRDAATAPAAAAALMAAVVAGVAGWPVTCRPANACENVVTSLEIYCKTVVAAVALRAAVPQVPGAAVNLLARIAVAEAAAVHALAVRRCLLLYKLIKLVSTPPHNRQIK